MVSACGGFCVHECGRAYLTRARRSILFGRLRRCLIDVKGWKMAEIGEPVREIEIVPRETPVPEQLPFVEPLTPERELEPAA
jgi:hypothetical protein